MIPAKKVCGLCRHEKSFDEFYTSVTSKDGLQGVCRLCSSENGKLRRSREARGFLGPRQSAVMTYEEVGRELGISKQAVEQIEKRALRKLLEAAKKMGC